MDQFALFLFYNFYCFQNQIYDVWRSQNPYSFVQIRYDFTPNPDNYYQSFLKPEVKDNVFTGNNSSNSIKQEQSFDAGNKNKGQLNDGLKVQENIQQVQKVKKHKHNNFLYYDPGEAPYLTYGIGDVHIRQIKSCKLFKTENVQKIDIELPQYKHNQAIQSQNAQKLFHFQATEPDPYFSPFLIIKTKPSKRRLLSIQQYQRRATQIEKRRIKNLHRLQIQERIGKKLPTKNKKWQRKKKSLVFNANQYKKKLMSSKKLKSSDEKFKELFTTEK